MRNSPEVATVGALKWWQPKYKGPEERARAAIQWAQHCLQRQTLRYAEFLLHAQLYEDRPSLGLLPWNYTDVMGGGNQRLRLNGIRAVADTYCSMISRSKPKPRVLTSGGDYTLKRRAKGLTKWYEGQLQDINFYPRVAQPCVKHSAVWGVGIAKVYRSDYADPEKANVTVETVYPWEMLVDDASAQNPEHMRCIGQRRYMDRDELAAMFPKDAEFILAYASSDSLESGYDTYFHDAAADMVPVVELWHLPTRGKDGRHVIVIEGRTLYDAEWTRETFPFHFLYRSRPTIGIWAPSIPHELLGMQQYLNTTLEDAEESQHAHAKPKWAYPVGSVNPAHLDDSLEGMIPFSGPTPPIRINGANLDPQAYAMIWQVWGKMFEQIGVSQARASGSIDPGLSGSGESIRMSNQVGDGRFYEANKNFEDWHMGIFRAMVDEARDIAEDNPEYASAYRGKSVVEIVKFKDVDPGRDRYFVATLPESNLSSLPAEREAQLTERFNSGIINADEYRQLSGFPDIEAEDDLANSADELTEKLVTRFLEADDPDAPDVMVYPEAEWPLAGMSQRMQFAEIRARLDNAPEGNVRLLREWIRLADDLIRKSQQPAPAATGAAPLTPGAPPPAPPPAMVPGAAMPAPPRAT